MSGKKMKEMSIDEYAQDIVEDFFMSSQEENDYINNILQDTHP